MRTRVAKGRGAEYVMWSWLISKTKEKLEDSRHIMSDGELPNL